MAARAHPELVQRIVEREHERACHRDGHVLVFDQSFLARIEVVGRAGPRPQERFQAAFDQRPARSSRPAGIIGSGR